MLQIYNFFLHKKWENPYKLIGNCIFLPSCYLQVHSGTDPSVHLGRSSRAVRGIGPIEPEDGGRYSWDDIFWDDRDVIDKTRLTNVKFIFKDGTTKVFSGYANIKKHMSSDAWD